MNKNIIRIHTIPNNIKVKVAQYIYKNLYIVGYKKISNKNKVPIIQLADNTRIWMLKKEIKSHIRFK
uniref:Cytochrome b6-f complex subunit PetP n=1 Tax=Bostrychia tenella TaxID=324755 RepID=A0A1Z1M676_9FLOR|nr:cytochrome b6-f complex subunit PetP [Bostrychia tenella]ARW61275.1 cytochrome b6-f complex subunit PetP [Bostrychia tenella]